MLGRAPREGWADADGVRLHYWDWPGDEPAVLAIHGITANGRSWDLLAERLGGRRRLLAVDLRGRGLSDKPPAGHYGWARHAADVAALLDSLGGQPALVAGHSMGGYVATLLAGTRPDLVRRLVVVDAGVGLDEADVRAQIGAALKRLEMVFPSPDAYLDYWRQVPFIPWSPAFERYVLADVDARPDGTVVSRASRAGVEEDLMDVYQPGRAEAFAAAARAVRAPAVVCWAPVGLLDPSRPLMPRASVEALAGLLPDARLVTLEGANHYTALMQAAAVARLAGLLVENGAADAGVGAEGAGAPAGGRL